MQRSCATRRCGHNNLFQLAVNFLPSNPPGERRPDPWRVGCARTQKSAVVGIAGPSEPGNDRSLVRILRMGDGLLVRPARGLTSGFPRQAASVSSLRSSHARHRLTVKTRTFTRSSSVSLKCRPDSSCPVRLIAAPRPVFARGLPPAFATRDRWSLDSRVRL
jgi:hypothetical protein